jgi:hypothetical protein
MSENDNGIPKIEVEVSIAAKDAFEHLLCRGGVAIAVDARQPGVVLPEHLLGIDVVLNYELDPPVPIPDLEATAEGIRATLSFSRTPFATFVPWGAVTAMGPMRPDQLVEKQKKPTLTLV